jgi:hypothetical protein
VKCTGCGEEMAAGWWKTDVPQRHGPRLTPVWICTACNTTVRVEITPTGEDYDAWRYAVCFTKPVYYTDGTRYYTKDGLPSETRTKEKP